MELNARRAEVIQLERVSRLVVDPDCGPDSEAEARQRE